MAGEYAIRWGSTGSLAQTLQSSNQFQYTDEIEITRSPGAYLPNELTVDFVIGNSTSSTAEAFDSITIDTSTGLSTNYTLTANKWFSQNTSTSVLKVYARLKTRYGTVYSYIKTITLNAPPIIVDPSFTSNFPNNSSVFIEGITSLTARCRTIGQFGATFGAQTGMTLIYNNGSTSGSVYMLQDDDGWYRTLNSLSAGNYNIGLRAKDSRGAITTYSTTVSVKAHTAPNLSYEVFRCDSNGDRDMSGAYISVTAWSIANPSELGISSITVQGVETGTTTEIIPQTALTEGVASIFGGTLSPDKSYTLTITATDDAATYGATAQTATQEVVVPVVVRIINVKEGGTGIAFAKRATEDKVIGKPDDWAWEGINEGFDSTGWASAVGTSGAVTVKTWNITEDGVYAITATSYQTRAGYTAAQQATMNSSLVVGRYDSSDTALETYSQRSPLTGGGDCTVSAIMRCTAGEAIKCKVQQFAGSSGATLSSQTFYVRSALIKLV